MAIYEHQCHLCGRHVPVDQMLFLDKTMNFPLVCTRCESDYRDDEKADTRVQKFRALLCFRDVIQISYDNEVLEKHEELLQYRQLVFPKKDIKIWADSLTKILGPSQKPIGKDTELFHRKLTEQFGGLEKSQDLHCKDFGAYRVLAMLWPWRDDLNVTFKAAIVQN